MRNGDDHLTHLGSMRTIEAAGVPSALEVVAVGVGEDVQPSGDWELGRQP